MKKIEAIIRENKLEELKEALMAKDIDGMTISPVLGCGNQRGWKEYYRSSQVMINFLPKIMVMMVVNDEKVEMIIDVITKISQTGEVGDGKIFISDVSDCIRIRTGERGPKAL